MTDKSREAFEKWVGGDRPVPKVLHRDEHGYYMAWTEASYRSWEACNEWRNSLLDSEEMQEKFAEAIYQSVYSSPQYYWFHEHKELYKKHAKAALKAMKEGML